MVTSRPGLSPDGRTAYLEVNVDGGWGPVGDGVAVVDVLANEVVRRIPASAFALVWPVVALSALRWPTVAADGKVYFSAETRIAVLDVAPGTGAYLSPEWTGGVGSLCLAPGGDVLYALAGDDLGDAHVWLVDPAHGTATKTAAVPQNVYQPHQMAVTPGGDRLCLLSADQNPAAERLRVVRTVNLVPGAPPVEAGPEVGVYPQALAATDDHAFVIAANAGDPMLTRVGLRPETAGVYTVALTPDSQPADVAVTADGRFVYVQNGTGTVTLLDGRSLAVLAPAVLTAITSEGMTISRDGRVVCLRTSETTVTTLRVPPVVTGVEPVEAAVPAGPTGPTVTVVGTGLDGATRVVFGTTPAAILGLGPGPLGTALQVTAPVLATGPQPVTVETPAGISSRTDPPPLFRYLPHAVITKLLPESGVATGETEVRILGANLADATVVLIDLAPVTPTAVEPDGSAVTVTVPAAPGAADVHIAVRTPHADSNTLTFRRLAVPVVTRLEPAAGPLTGLPVTITGSDLSAGPTPTVRFGEAPAVDVAVDLTDPLHPVVHATAPEVAAPTTATVTVTTAGGTSGATQAARFTYLAAPAVSELKPAGLAEAGGRLEIVGKALGGVEAVLLDTAPTLTEITGFVAASDESVTVTAPSWHAGAVGVRVRTPAGTSAPTVLTYFSRPVVDAIEPAVGAAGVEVVIRGAGLTAFDRPAVLFGDTPASTVDGDPGGDGTVLHATAPDHAPGQVAVVVRTPGGSSGERTFTYVPAPALDSPVLPLTGHPEQQITLTGTNLGPVETLTIGTTDIPRPKLVIFGVGGTTLRFFAPPGTGTVDITVTSPGGTSNPVAFTYA